MAQFIITFSSEGAEFVQVAEHETPGETGYSYSPTSSPTPRCGCRNLSTKCTSRHQK